MDMQIQEKIVSDVAKNKYSSILADDTADVSQIEQLNLSVPRRLYVFLRQLIFFMKNFLVLFQFFLLLIKIWMLLYLRNCVNLFRVGSSKGDKMVQAAFAAEFQVHKPELKIYILQRYINIV